MTNYQIQDTISFQLRSETVVTNDTVKISVPINIAIAGNITEDNHRELVKKAISSFIRADWIFGGSIRSDDNTGFEKISLVATARVSEKENYNLLKRAEMVSTVGLQLGAPIVDTTIPTAKLEAAEQELRLIIIQKAREELANLNTKTSTSYRLSNVAFSNHSDPLSRKTSATMLSPSNYGSSVVPDENGDDTLINSQKLTMVASVVFANIVK